MTKLEDVSQQDIENLDERLNKAMERLKETALQVKAERDKYAAVLHRLLREVSVKPTEVSFQWIEDTIKDVLEE